MNYLAHLYLAERSGTSLIGSLMGDFVHGRLPPGRFPLDIERGIRLHRRVDSFTDAHAAVRASRRRLRSPFRRYGGILIDMFYDHFLARDWEMFHDQPLSEFAQRTYALLEARTEVLAEALRRAVPHFRSCDLLVSYRNPSGIERALHGLSRRLSRPNPLPSGISELTRNYHQFERDFHLFMPQVEVFAHHEAERMAASAV